MSDRVNAADVSVNFDDPSPTSVADLCARLGMPQPDTVYSAVGYQAIGQQMAAAISAASQGLGQLGRAMNGTASGHFRSKLELRPAPPVLREPLPLRESMMLLQSSVEAAAEQRDDMRPNRYDSLRAQVVVDFDYVRRQGPKSTKAKQRTSPQMAAFVNTVDREHQERLQRARPERGAWSTWLEGTCSWTRYGSCRRDAWQRASADLSMDLSLLVGQRQGYVEPGGKTITFYINQSNSAPLAQPVPSQLGALMAGAATGLSSGSLRIVGVTPSVLTLDRRSTRIEPRQVTGRQPKLPKSRRRKRGQR